MLKESITKHAHIRIHLAVLFHKGEHLILLPWADNLDLDLFLLEGRSFNGTSVYDFDTRFPKARKGVMIKDVCNQMYLIAGALEWLHKGIRGGKQQSRVHFAHMDLKPNNILIDIDKRSAVGKWLLTDFGISAFKEDNESSPTGLLSIRDLYENLTINTTPRRDPGAYQPPEVQRMTRENRISSNEGSAGRKGDIWSFACIFSEALAFALGQSSAVKDFRSSRTKRHNNDYFYETAPSQYLQANNQNGDYRVRTEVIGCLQKLSVDYVYPNRVIDCCVATILETLVVDGSQRPKAQELVSKMEHVIRHINAAREPGKVANCPLDKRTSVSTSSTPPPTAPIQSGLPHHDTPPLPIFKRQNTELGEVFLDRYGHPIHVGKEVVGEPSAGQTSPFSFAQRHSNSDVGVGISFTQQLESSLEPVATGQACWTPPISQINSSEQLSIHGLRRSVPDSRSSFSRDYRSVVHGVTINQDIPRKIGRTIELPVLNSFKAKVHAISLCPSGLRLAELITSPESDSQEVAILNISLDDRYLKLAYPIVALDPGRKWDHVVLAGDNMVTWGNVGGGQKYVSS